MKHAERGIMELKEAVDSIITIPNQRLLTMVDEKIPIDDAFNMADQILCQSVRGISDLITDQGKINLDFADVKTIMSGKGTALMGTGTAKGESRAINAVRMAISNPLMEDTTVDGATGVLLNITGGKDVTLREIDEAATTIHESVHEDATIIFGMVEELEMQDEIRVMVIATGTDVDHKKVIKYDDYLKRADQSQIRPPLRPDRIKRPFTEDGKKNRLIGNSINAKEFGVIPGDDHHKDEDLDVPTFLRRQAD